MYRLRSDQKRLVQLLLPLRLMAGPSIATVFRFRGGRW
jgi:hypothetical protein